jgi:phosphotriesterase-related protein
MSLSITTYTENFTASFQNRCACVNTIRGPIPVNSLGRVLIHEHVFCLVPDRHFAEASTFLRSHLQRLFEQGISTIVDVTPYTIPDKFIPILADLPINIVACVGFYLEPRVPAAYRNYTVTELLGVLRRKIDRGVGRFSVHPHMLKGAGRTSTLSAMEKRLIRALALAQQEYDLPLQMHACRGGRAQLELLLDAGADPSKIIICHTEMGLKGRSAASFDAVLADAMWMLGQGASLFIGDFPVRATEYKRQIIALTKGIISQGFEKQLLLSVDSYWSINSRGVSLRGTPGNRENERSYSYLVTEILPSLRRAGISDPVLERILVSNPARLFSPSR